MNLHPDYVSIFNTNTGLYLRGGKNNQDPFRGHFPELLDIGIMGHCKNTELCKQAGIDCYQNSGRVHTPNMSLEDYKSIINQSKGKVFQVALGGRGDPEQHENFEEILKITKDAHIVPNFTTSGIHMTEEIAAICKKYCGAVAVSWHNQDYTQKAIKTLLRAGVKTNIHYVFHKDNLDDAIHRLKTDDFPQGINAVVFLLYKPVGHGREDKVISVEDKRLSEFFSLTEKEHIFKVGFDSCSVPGIINFCNHTSMDTVDTCEGGRWSAYISSDMKMMPCSFANQTEEWSVDLKVFSVKEAWESKVFQSFRKILCESCPGCEKREFCLGGCPLMEGIQLCKEKIS